MSIRCSLVFWAILLSSTYAAGEQHLARLGDLNLASGEVISNCQIGYRTYGNLNAAKNNVIVMPTWHTGSTQDLESYELVGPNKLLDTNEYFVITIDALANGVSSSPSNSVDQPGASFPQVSLADMVYSQHRLLTEHLDIQSIHAMVGISMGGMQTFQWIRQYPDFMQKAVAIDGSPYMTSYDVIQWQTHVDVVTALQESGYDESAIARILGPLSLLTLWTPDYIVENVAREDLDAFLAQDAKGYDDFDANNYIIQTQAMIDHNAFGSGTEEYASNIQDIAADLLVVNVPQDHMVNPATAKALALEIGAKLIEVDSNCGHLGTTCEGTLVVQKVSDFLR